MNTGNEDARDQLAVMGQQYRLVVAEGGGDDLALLVADRNAQPVGQEARCTAHPNSAAECGVVSRFTPTNVH